MTGTDLSFGAGGEVRLRVYPTFRGNAVRGAARSGAGADATGPKDRGCEYVPGVVALGEGALGRRGERARGHGG